MRHLTASVFGMCLALFILVLLLKIGDIAVYAMAQRMHMNVLIVVSAAIVRTFLHILNNLLQHTVFILLCFIAMIVVSAWSAKYRMPFYSAWAVTAAFSIIYQAFVTAVIVCNFMRLRASGNVQNE